MTPNQFQKIALSFPGTVEGEHGGHPDFRIDGKIFASIGVPDDSWGMVKLTPEQQNSLIRSAPKMFRPCSGSWGLRGYTNVNLATAKTGLVKLACELAFENIDSPAKAKTKVARTVAGVRTTKRTKA